MYGHPGVFVWSSLAGSNPPLGLSSVWLVLFNDLWCKHTRDSEYHVTPVRRYICIQLFRLSLFHPSISDHSTSLAAHSVRLLMSSIRRTSTLSTVHDHHDRPHTFLPQHGGYKKPKIHLRQVASSYDDPSSLAAPCTYCLPICSDRL